MERLLVLKLDAQACEAEAWLNGVPLARVHPGRPRVVVPVHEYTLAGLNRLELVVWPRPSVLPAGEPLPPPLPLRSDGQLSAHVRLLLPRAGHVADEASARTLAQLDWTPAASQAYEAPLSLSQELELPVSFPRWRWLEAPAAELSSARQQQALTLVQGLATSLAAGEFDEFVSATRLRTEELALAYQQPPEEAVSRVRSHLSRLYAAGQLNWQPLEPAGFALRSVAGGRLLECLDVSGEPALRTTPDAQGRTHLFPLRLAAVEGKLYVLR